LAAVTARLGKCVQAQWLESKQRHLRVASLFQALSPESTLARGYSVTTTADGKVLRSTKDARPKDRIVTRLRDGSIHSIVE
jgi:exodeoxyribonuclease VII large subunit